MAGKRNNFQIMLQEVVVNISIVIFYFRELQVDPSGEIITFHSSGCPWKEHLFDIEIEKHVKPEIKFIIYQDQHHHYRVQVF